MKTKKIEQNWLTKTIWFGKSFYALVCGLVLALAGWSYFLVSAGNIEVETDIENAVQTIRRIIVTSDWTSSGTPYFDLNNDLNGGAIFGNVPNSVTMDMDLWLDVDGRLIKQAPANNMDDFDWVKDGNDVYKTWNVAIGWNANGSHSYEWNLNILSSEANNPELYIKQSSVSAANIHFVDLNDNLWSMWVQPLSSNSYFYLNNWGPNILYVNDDYTAGINSNFTISWSLDMYDHNIYRANIVNAVLFVQTSDEALKENLQTIKNPLDKIYALNGYTFDWKKDWSHDVGLIAQEVEKVLPELVHVDTNGHKWVQYSNMVALLIEWIKELGNKIDGLYNKYLDQQNKIDNLENRLEILENK